MSKRLKSFLHSKLFVQILRFGVVGGLAFLIDSSILYVLTEYAHIYVLYSSIISFIVSLIFNYVMSIFWVFDVEKKQGVKEVLLFAILSTIGLGVNQLVMYLGVEVFHIYYMFCKVMATFIVMVYNFITRKIFIEK